MHLTFDVLNILDAIARHDSFAAAAEALNRVPSALTYSIKKLEQDLGVALFDRSGYRTQLTLLGRELLEGGRSLLQQGLELEEKIKTGKSFEPQVISIAYDDIIAFECLEPIINDFFNALPHISLRLSAEILNGPLDALETGRADIAIAALGKLPSDSSYQFTALDYVPFVFAVAPHHPLASAPEPLSKPMIQAHKIVQVSDTSTQLLRLSSGYTPGLFSLVVPTMHAKLKAQLAGLGVGFLPKYMATPYLEKGFLREKVVEHPKMGGRFAIVWNPRKAGTTILKAISLVEKYKKKLFMCL